MRIAMKCSCGATFEAEDTSGYSTSPEREGEKWRNEHIACRISGYHDGAQQYENWLRESPDAP